MTTITPENALAIYLAAEIGAPSTQARLVVLGFPEPKTLLDVWNIAKAAHAAMSDRERAATAAAANIMLSPWVGARPGSGNGADAFDASHARYVKIVEQQLAHE